MPSDTIVHFPEMDAVLQRRGDEMPLPRVNPGEIVGIPVRMARRGVSFWRELS